MEYTEGAVREFLSGLVAEALAGDKPGMSVRFAQKRFVKKDPTFVACTWPAKSGAGQAPREFIVAFSGEAVDRFANADEDRLGRLRAAAIAFIREERKRFDTSETGAYPFLCQIDVLKV
jgi:hypothetical protein